MAYALVSALIEQLISIVRQEVEQEVRLVVGVDEDVKKLQTTLKYIQAVLKDAEEKQVKKQVVKVWLEELIQVAYDMDDVLDEWITEILIRSEIHNARIPNPKKKVLMSKLFFLCNSFSQVSLRHDIGHKIKEIKGRLDVIAKDKDQFQLIDSGMRTTATTTTTEEPPTFRMTSSLIVELDVCGRAEDKDIILSKLLSESSQQETPNVLPVVISICGIGGIGKTTLAQMVFNDDEVNSYFEKRMWVCVSDSFDLTRLAKSIIEASGEDVPNSIQWEFLHKKLYTSVTGKRFLLVLDDMWTEDHTDWSPLKLALNDGAQGSRIVVTTRSEKVALMMGSTYTHDLGQLSDEKCWLLFKRIAFQGRSKEECGKLEDIGYKITKKCKGVPLFVKTLGSLMLFKRNRREWEQVLESDAWKLQEVEKGVLPALLLSYDALPSDVKRCFTYCAIFPKDHKIGKDELIKLWMAQGLLNSLGRRELEVVGAEYFNELLMRSFFQYLERDDDGNIIYYKMHDLIHDFAQFLTKTECFIIDGNNTEFNSNSKKVRHLNVTRFTDLSSILPSIYEAKNLRTLIIDGHSWASHSVPALSNLFCQLTCLRELSLCNRHLEELPNEVEKLIHLRYFDLSRTRLKELPETMSRLYNLQTLKLYSCTWLGKLPQGIGKMINLRHLKIEGTNELSYLPQGIGRLSSLRTLSKFIVGDVRGGGCKIVELKYLNHLQGDLEIFGLEKVEDVNEANEAQLKNKQHLHGLKLIFECDNLGNMGEGEIKRIEGVLEGLQPHRNLEEFRMQSYLGSKFPNWVDDSMLPNLVALEIVDCKICVQVPAFGKFQFLQKLKIKNMDGVKFMGQVFGRIAGSDGLVTVSPRLKELDIDGMANLEEWDLRLEDGVIMPCLSKLTLIRFPKVHVLPALGNLPILESLKIEEMNSVKHVGLEFLGINVDVDDGAKRGGGESRVVVAFPKLKKLSLSYMNEWEDSEMLTREEEEEHAAGRDIIIIMPLLHSLTLYECCKLKELPHYIFPASLRILSISHCPKLSWTPCLPPLLEELFLTGDVGVLSRSFPTNRNNSNYLKLLQIHGSPHSSLPEGLAHLTSLQSLYINLCHSLKCMSEELQHLPSLQELRIISCSVLGPRCRKVVGEDWSIISHIPKIIISSFIGTHCGSNEI